MPQKIPGNPEHPPEPRILRRSEHSISRSRMDPDALKVLYRLHRNGHVACLAGGAVRDLLLGRSPKDFDLSTSAHPHEVKRLFSNCRLIGRRFRLAHVYFHGGKVIEVSTFRTISEFGTEEGPITSDNTFGTQAEDAFRRDFTVNALFYDIADFSVIDHVGGLEDLKRGLIRCIGDPWVRFREDPIRMLRGIRFAGLLGFSLEENTAAALRSLRQDIWKGALPRIQEEVLRMMVRGTALPCFSRLVHYGFSELLFPGMSDADTELALAILHRLDEAHSRGVILEPCLALSCLLFPTFERTLSGRPSADPLSLAREVIEAASPNLQITRRVQESMRQIMAAQSRLLSLGRPRFRPSTMLRKTYFSHALTLLGILRGGDEEGKKLIAQWRELTDKVPPPGPRPGRRRRRRRGRRGNGTPREH